MIGTGYKLLDSLLNDSSTMATSDVAHLTIKFLFVS